MKVLLCFTTSLSALTRGRSLDQIDHLLRIGHDERVAPK